MYRDDRPTEPKYDTETCCECREEYTTDDLTYSVDQGYLCDKCMAALSLRTCSWCGWVFQENVLYTVDGDDCCHDCLMEDTK